MKRILILMLLATTAFVSTQAQTTVKYHGSIEGGYSVAIGENGLGRLNFNTIQGIKVSNYFSTGVGLGLDYYHEPSELMLPVYLNLKGYLPIDKIASAFVSFDIGYGVGLTEGVKKIGGLLYSPAIGIQVKHFKFQVGFTSQRFSYAGLGVNSNAIQFKLGYVF